MGQIKELSCKCGYNKKLFLGSGLMSINERMVRKVFTQEELKDFDNAKKSGTDVRFMMENIKAYCPVCNDLFAVPILKYKTGNIERVIRKGCPECEGNTKDTVSCPKCGEIPDEKDAGYWD